MKLVQSLSCLENFELAKVNCAILWLLLANYPSIWEEAKENVCTSILKELSDPNDYLPLLKDMASLEVMFWTMLPMPGMKIFFFQLNSEIRDENR